MSTTPRQQLALLERQLAAQRAALDASPPWEPIHPGVLALLAAPPVELDVHEVAADDMPRVVEARRQLDAVTEELATRQLRVAGRLCALRQATHPRHQLHLFDALG